MSEETSNLQNQQNQESEQQQQSVNQLQDDKIVDSSDQSDSGSSSDSEDQSNADDGDNEDRSTPSQQEQEKGEPHIQPRVEITQANQTESKDQNKSEHEQLQEQKEAELQEAKEVFASGSNDRRISQDPPSSDEPKETDADDHEMIALGADIEYKNGETSKTSEGLDAEKIKTLSAKEREPLERVDSNDSKASKSSSENEIGSHIAPSVTDLSNESDQKSNEPQQQKNDLDGDISIPDANQSEYENESGNDDEEDDEPSDAEEDQIDEDEADGNVRKSGSRSRSRTRTAEPKDKQQQEQQTEEQTTSKNEEEAVQTGTTEAKPDVDLSKEEHEHDHDHEQQKDEPYIPQTHTIVIPSYASWFKFDQIHPIEKESLPEFFTNQIPSKTPQIYVKYRNFLINVYRLNPNDYLTVTAARRNLVGDVGTILRVHRFLSRWGLINYQVDAQDKPTPVEPPFTGDYTVTYDAPRGLFPFESFKPNLEQTKLDKLKELKDLKQGTKRELNGDDNNSKKEDPKDTTTTANGTDFKKPKIVKNINDGWTREDLKKLLEGITQHKNDWESISNHVGTKTVEQCIIRFLKLPIEDQFLGDSKQNLGPLKYAPYLPFQQSDNPVLSTVAFLVSLVDPEVVKAATSSAIQIIDSKDVDKTLNEEEKGETNVTNGIEESAKIALSTVGVRGHVFKTNEEIEMNKLTNVIVNTQLRKIELKTSQLNSIEKELDLEKKILQKQQEDLFLDRLSFTKNSNQVISKFDTILGNLQSSSTTSPDVQQLSNLISEAKELLSKPVRAELSSFDLSKRDSKSGTVDHTNEDGETNGTGPTVDDDDLKPISIETPQTYRYWSG
ncbi:SWI/SNF complex subunit SWI3 [Wickerhamomyces ciferrii]|uniref:SWI/SNF complex subunit SWI3 n=1 Tax=Wickerhamomyces ciferrii (strain ATCC 14091 / BCRC 22168 / CBS 111 / JCM 3599 / NBRC 0793 / NRRL Y-1031 F-60-10) TaxID=1206466 RepID=K0KL96_WICCF|nr:SWI/SNF complex subunit SWI3 [Wickerhamomyces ciferrii]CCH42967.1 SWI/SNF complex subunit SWI3 [Wickerhamomyces ciferrii]